jgi:hypothetical protein
VAKAWQVIGKTEKSKTDILALIDYWDDSFKLKIGQDIVAIEMDTETTLNLMDFLRENFNFKSHEEWEKFIEKNE